ncbi:I78 family peptidase inhibitor [Agrilutibacter solisilvae]|uniref:Strain R19 chromosome, complete genome n=1 Tax=Agrilutibacter solisilvae TaxID=2763317 RepID=A0A974Y0E8_9GAMM|nr:I78 family peptidase inhibitor [Lysobacter solisilvae]QSX79121.1 Elastase inhibitor AFLEI Flags: Precursor [Lysobacter solisilvae]
MIRRALSTALLTVCLAACATAGSEAGTPPPAADPAPPTQPSPTPPQASCNADAARIVVGQVATPDVVEKARLAAGAQLVRTLKPGQVVTMEYHSSRLNIDVNEGNTVTNVRCG